MQGAHADFLRRQIDDPATVAVRTDHGFLIALRRASVALVDDFTVDADDRWATDGRALLAAAWRAVSDEVDALRVVTARADEPKVDLLRAAGLRLVEQWWVKPIDGPPSNDAPPRPVQGPGFSGVIGPAPPVCDPGGPVLLVNRFSETSDPGAVEREAARLGAVLAVLPLPPDRAGEPQLRQREWAVASQWYQGQPT